MHKFQLELTLKCFRFPYNTRNLRPFKSHSLHFPIQAELHLLGFALKATLQQAACFFLFEKKEL